MRLATKDRATLRASANDRPRADAVAIELNGSTLFVSDAHLGSPEGSLERFLALVRQAPARNLVLVGDIVDIRSIVRNGTGKSSILKIATTVLEELDRFERVFYVVGNHDELLVLLDGATFRNLTIASELAFAGPAYSTLVLHGHQADPGARVNIAEWKVDIVCWFYYQLHRIDRTLNRLAPRWFSRGGLIRAIKQRSELWQTHRRRFVEQVCRLAGAKGFSRVICGHIHWPEVSVSSGVTYANCGDWIESYTALMLDDQHRLWRITYDDESGILMTPSEARQ